MSRDSPPDRTDGQPGGFPSLGRRSRVAIAIVAVLAISVAVPAGNAIGEVNEDGPEFEENGFGTVDRTAAINVSLQNGSSATFVLSDPIRNQSGYLVELNLSATIVDANEDGRVELTLDTQDVSPDGTPLSAAGGDRVRDITVRNATANGTLYGGGYDLSLVQKGNPTDFAVLAVTNAPEGPTPRPTPTNTPTTPTQTPQHQHGTVLVHDGENMTVPAEDDVEIHGETHLPPGTDLRVTVESRSDSSPRFYHNPSTTVNEDGTFAIEIDLSAQSPGDTFSVTVSGNGTDLTTESGRVGDCTDCETSTETPTETATVSATGPPSFQQETYHVVQSRTIDIALGLGNTSTATLVIGHYESEGYEQRVLVEDSPNDPDNSRAVVGFSTWAAGTNRTTVSAESAGDVVRPLWENDLSSLLAVGGYDLALYAGNGTDGEPIDTATLQVHEVPSWDELNETPEPDSETIDESVTNTTSSAPMDPTEDRSELFGIGGIVVGAGLGIGGVLLVLRGFDTY